MNKLQKCLLSTVSIIILAVVSVNILSQFLLPRARVDLTQGSLYSVSVGTKKVLSNLEEPINLSFYYSDELKKLAPNFATYGRRIINILEEYSALSGGKVKVRVINPDPFSEAEDEALGHGLKGAPIDESGQKVYFGLVGTNSLDGKEIISFFAPDREKFIEYDLTKLVHGLTTDKKPVIGLLSTINFDKSPANPYGGGQSEPWMIMDQMKQMFDVQTLDQAVTHIKKDVSILMLVHPTGLSDQTLYAIDQFVMRGGQLLAFLDPSSDVAVSKMDQQQMMQFQFGGQKSSSTLSRLLTTWGIEFSGKAVVGDRSYAQRINTGSDDAPEVSSYLPWLSLKNDAFNKSDLLTSDLKTVNMATAGFFTKKTDSSLEFTPLIQSSKDSMAIDVSKLGGFRPDAKGLLKNFKSEDKQHTLAVRLRGKVKTAFPNGFPKPEPKEPKAGEEAETPKDSVAYPDDHMASTQNSVNMILVGDTDILDNRFWVRVQNFLGQSLSMPFANNNAFVMNALENLSGGDAFISLRSRDTANRPFVVIENLKRKAEDRLQAKEKELRDRIMHTENKLRDLQRGKGGDDVSISAEQQVTISTFQKELVVARKALRSVQHDLKKDIRSVERRILFMNVALVPLIILILWFVVPWYRKRRS
jgi:ABC-type uncharacterized transport system involved in gliding motility auxiliary subunit